MKIYLASSWRNDAQPVVLAALRAAGYETYDFRNPALGEEGFSWREIDPNWQDWTADEYRRALQHPIAEHGYELDISALRVCEVCVLLLPSGRSASWEFGYAMGQGKQGIVLQMGKVEPELMYREAEIATSVDELLHMLRLLDRKDLIRGYLEGRRTDDGTYPDVEEHRARMNERESDLFFSTGTDPCTISTLSSGVCPRGIKGCTQGHVTDEP